MKKGGKRSVKLGGMLFDPVLLDAFLAMASALYQELAGREDEGLRQEVEEITEKYFSRDAEIQLD